MTISTLTINAQVYNEVLETFLILLNENRFAGFFFFFRIIHLATEQSALNLFIWKGISKCHDQLMIQISI